MNIVQTKETRATSIAEQRNDAFRIFKNRTGLHRGGVPRWFVYINDYAWEAFLSHTHAIYARTGHEGQGIFGGKYFEDELGQFAVATTYYEGEGSSSHSHVEMSEECLSTISRHCQEEGLQMLIWVHTHPTFGPFYSGTDSTCLKTNFFMPFQIGIVVDIVKEALKGFKVDSGEVVEFDDYALYNEEQSNIWRPYQRKEIGDRIEIKKKSSEGVATLPEEAVQELKAVNETLEAIRGVLVDEIQKEMASADASGTLSSELCRRVEKIQTETETMRLLLETTNRSVATIVEQGTSRKKKNRRKIITIIAAVILFATLLIVLRY